MKAVADTHCRDQEYQVGDWVLVKLRQHRQSSATGTTYSKLTKCYYGPFQVTERMGKVAYKLQLPEHSRIHPVFHCSLLKPYVASNTPTDAADLPPMAVDNHHVITPLAIVASKLIPSEFSPTLRTRCCLMGKGVIRMEMMGVYRKQKECMRKIMQDPQGRKLHQRIWKTTYGARRVPCSRQGARSSS